MTEMFTIKNKRGHHQIVSQIECDENTLQQKKLGLAILWAYSNKIDLTDADLRNAYLQDVDLKCINLWGADLQGANLRDTNLQGADFQGADLQGANLRDTDLQSAHLRGADLRNADLKGANLRDTDLKDTNLWGADLRNTNLWGADLSDADLRGADLGTLNENAFKADFWLVLSRAQNEISGLVKALREGRVDGSQYEGECACLVGTLANVRQVSVTTFEKNSERPSEKWFMMIQEGDKPDHDSGGGFAAKKAITWIQEFCQTFGVTLDEPTV